MIWPTHCSALSDGAAVVHVREQLALPIAHPGRTAKLKYRNWPKIRVRVRVKPELEVWSLVDGRGEAPLGFRPDRGRWGFRFLLRYDVRSPTLRPRQMTLSLILGKFK